MLHSFFANDEEKKEESDDEEDSKLEEAIGGWDDKDEGSVAADQIKSKGISFDTTCNDYFEENIERLLDDNLSLIKANRFIPMEEADELSDVDLSENDEDDIDEVAATSEEEVEIKKIASEDTKDEIKAIIHNSTKDSEMRHNQPQVEGRQSLEVPTVGEEATPETDKKEEDNNEAFGGAEPNTSILSLFLAEIEEGSSDNTSEETSAEEVTEIPKPRPMHREPNTIFSNQDLKSLVHQYELKRIDLIDSEDDKFDEAIGGPIEISCHSSKIESLPKRQVTWEEDSLTTNRDQPDSSKAYKKNGKNIKKKKEKKAKKSRFSCLIGCFYPNVHHDEEYDADCNLTMISHPRAPMWGRIEDNLFNKLISPTAMIDNFSIRIVSNILPTESHKYKTKGIFYTFSNTVYLKMEIILKKKIIMKPAGHFSLFISNPNRVIFNEIEIHYNLFEMPSNSMLICRQTKFDSSSKKKLAVLEMRYFKFITDTTYLYSKLRLLLNRCGNGDCPYLITLDRDNQKYDIFSLK